MSEGVEARYDSGKEGTDGSWFLLRSVQTGILSYAIFLVLNLGSPGSSQIRQEELRLQE